MVATAQVSLAEVSVLIGGADEIEVEVRIDDETSLGTSDRWVERVELVLPPLDD